MCEEKCTDCGNLNYTDDLEDGLCENCVMEACHECGTEYRAEELDIGTQLCGQCMDEWYEDQDKW